MAKKKAQDPKTPKAPKARRGRGEGSITQVEDGRWCGRLSYIDGQGKRKRPVFYGESKKEVQDLLRAHQTKMATGQVVDGGDVLMVDYFDSWLKAKKPTVAPTTYAPYADHVKRFLKPLLGKLKLSKLNANHVQNLYEELAKKGSLPPCKQKSGELSESPSNMRFSRYAGFSIIPPPTCPSPRFPRRR